MPAGAPSAQGDMLRVSQVSAGYDRRPVLRQFSLEPLPAGTITAIVGPNGAGKSTLLRAVAGLLPASGRISLGAHELLSMSPGTRARHIGFMPQALPAGIGLSVIETVIGAFRAAGDAGPQVDARAASVLERLGILPLALEPLDRLSGGQRQMASLAQAIAREPALLLLDEPTSALDLRHQVRLMLSIRRLAGEGRIIVVVLHDLSLAARWSDRVVVMDEGRLAAQGGPADVITVGMLRAVYGIEARVERCSAGFLQIMTDGLTGAAQAP